MVHIFDGAITPENFRERIDVFMTNPDPAKLQQTFTVRGDILGYLAMCFADVQETRAAEVRALAGRHDNTFKPDSEIPAFYKKIATAGDGDCWEHNGLRIIRSGDEIDGKKWIHVSFSRRSKDPSYEDMVQVKRDFFGKDAKAIMVLPGAAMHVNIHPHCLHLFHCQGDDGLPEFSWGGKTI